MEPLEERHAETFFEGLQAVAIYEFLDEDPPRDLAALRARYRRLEQRRSSDGSETWLNWAVRSIDDQIYLGYVQATIRVGGSALIAYVLFPDVWRRGFGSEAVLLMLEELARGHQVRELFATVDERNDASIALLRKIGFKQICERSASGDLVFRLLRRS